MVKVSYVNLVRAETQAKNKLKRQKRLRKKQEYRYYNRIEEQQRIEKLYKLLNQME